MTSPAPEPPRRPAATRAQVVHRFLGRLHEVLDEVNGAAEVLLDSGVRLGSDAVKAVAIGARAVLIGRPFVMGLAVAGEDGVRHMIELFRYEIDRTLGMMGCPSLTALDRSYVQLPAEWMEGSKS